MAFLPSHVFTFSPTAFTPSHLFNFDESGIIEANVAISENSAVLDEISGTFGFFVDLAEENPVLDDFSRDFAWNCEFFDNFAIFDDFGRRWAKRYTVTELQANSEATRSLSRDNALTQDAALFLESFVETLWQNARPLAEKMEIAINGPSPTFTERLAAQNAAAALRKETNALFRQLKALRFDGWRVSVESAQKRSNPVKAGFDVLELIRSKTLHRIDDSAFTVHEFIRIAYLPSSVSFLAEKPFIFAPTSFLPSHNFVFSGTMPQIGFLDTKERSGIRHAANSLFQSANSQKRRFCALVQKARKPPPGQSFIQVDPPRDPPVTPPGHVTHTIPGRTYYMINHVLNVTLLDGTPISMETVNLSLDVDSFAWNFSGNLADKGDLALVQPPPNADPVQLLITVNTITFKVVVERIQHSWQFGQRQISLSGRSLSALLGLPYEQPQSATQTAELTIQQLAELQLPLGWTITWNMPVWLVPGTAFTYTQQTPIQVLMGMANDIGAIIKPHRTNLNLTFMPRYPVGPWQFSAATPDLIVPESAILNITLRPPVKLDLNGVYVHGGEIGGEIGWCRLNGSDGARLAPTVSNSLITDAAAARALGERILAANQTQPAIQSITVPMDNADFPLAEVGWLVQITVEGSPVRGIINSVALQATLDSVHQTLQIGEETPNNWTLFKDLLPRDPLLVGTLSVTDGVTSLMTLLDGGVIRVRGTGAVNSKYYIRGGRIDGEAPNLTQNEIVI